MTEINEIMENIENIIYECVNNEINMTIMFKSNIYNKNNMIYKIYEEIIYKKRIKKKRNNWNENKKYLKY